MQKFRLFYSDHYQISFINLMKQVYGTKYPKFSLITFAIKHVRIFEIERSALLGIEIFHGGILLHLLFIHFAIGRIEL